MKGISRIDSGNTFGYFVRGYRNTKVFSKFFSDARNGGKRKALQAAKAFRDDLHAELEQEAKQPPAQAGQGSRPTYYDPLTREQRSKAAARELESEPHPRNPRRTNPHDD